MVIQAIVALEFRVSLVLAGFLDIAGILESMALVEYQATAVHLEFLDTQVTAEAV